MNVKELPIDSALGLLATINIARTHSVSTGAVLLVLQLSHVIHSTYSIPAPHSLLQR